MVKIVSGFSRSANERNLIPTFASPSKWSEVGVSHSCASPKQVPSHNLQVSSNSQVTVVRIKQVTSQVIAQVKQVTSQVIQKSDDLTQFPHLKIGKESGS